MKSEHRLASSATSTGAAHAQAHLTVCLDAALDQTCLRDLRGRTPEGTRVDGLGPLLDGTRLLDSVWAFVRRADPQTLHALAGRGASGSSTAAAPRTASGQSLRVWIADPVADTDMAELLALGADDLICGGAAAEALQHFEAHAKGQAATEALLQSELVQDNLGGSSPRWTRFLREVVTASRQSASPCLVQGETGVGKELVTRLIHTLDPRASKGDLVVVDCTNLTAELAGSELFGHERGAFTGAHAGRRGAAELADGGTLFLDEIGELPAEVQARLLRVLQEGAYKRLGGDAWHKVNFRLVCATHRDLWQWVQQGRFRADLYYRIAGTKLAVPALRERGDDCLELALRFLDEASAPARIDPLLRALLRDHDFPGNVRELRQLMQQAAARHHGTGPVSLGDMPLDWREHMLSRIRRPRKANEADVAPLAAEGPQAEPAPPTPTPTPTPPTQTLASEVIWVRHCLQSGLGLRDITQRAGDLAIDAALALEGNHVRRAASRLGVTERAIQLRRAALKTPTPAPH